MNSDNTETTITLADAVMLACDCDCDYTDDLALCLLDITTTADERKATARLWLHLTAVATGTPLEAIAGIELLTDRELFAC